MTNAELIKSAQANGIKLTIVPFSCFSDIVDDINVFKERTDLNEFQKWIASERYMLDFPELEFTPESLVVTAVRLKVFDVTFLYRGRDVKTTLEIPDTSKDVGKFLKENGAGHVFYDYWMPQKRLAVRSGLAEYGKNNICFAGGFGSLITLSAFITDIPCDGEYVWREVKNMDECDLCGRCRESCPTGAISFDSFLIDSVNCLTAINEYGTEPFPSRVPKTAHHRPVQCIQCQKACPVNKGLWDDVEKSVTFTEEETELLLSGTSRESLPPALGEKLDTLNMNWYYKSLPRNLRAMLDNA